MYLQHKANLFAEYLGKCCFLMSKGDLFVGGSIHQDGDQVCFEGKTIYFYESFILLFAVRRKVVEFRCTVDNN